MKSTFKVLTDREHVLSRPGMYIGQVSEQSTERFINGKLEHLKIVPALFKITNELIDNAVDEFLRSDKKFANLIEIEINKKSFKIKDNGRGIPVELYEGQLRPVLCWTTARAGTSFSEDRVGAGANGVGSVTANIFSKKFSGQTFDGVKICNVYCTDNMSNVSCTQKSKSTGKTYTEVYIEPDFERFGVSGYSDDIIRLLKERLTALASIHPEICFKFNSEKISCKRPKEYLKSFSETFVSYFSEDYFIGIFSSPIDRYITYSVIDGLDLQQGGALEEYVSRVIASELRLHIKKKHKIDITPSELKQGLFFIINGRNFKNMKFDSQTKERLTNTEAEVREYLGEFDFVKFAKDIFKCDEIILPIIETKLAIQAAKDARAVASAQKQMKRVKVAKHTPANNRNPNDRVLIIFEGDSAAGGAAVVRDVARHGLFPIRGIPMNCFEASNKDIVSNAEFNNIMNIVGLDITKQEINKMQYGQIAIFNDADADGAGAIFPLLLNFFFKWPELYTKNKIKYIPSPRYILSGKSKKSDVLFFYTEEEYEKFKADNNINSYEVRYIKGLGSLRREELKQCLEDESKWITIEIDNPDCFRKMYSSKAIDERKEIILK